MFSLRTLYIYLLLSLVEGVDSKGKIKYLKQFFKVKYTHLKHGRSLNETKANAETCSKICFEDKKCLSFEVSNKDSRCKLYSEDSRDRKMMFRSGTDFYQLVRFGLNRAEYESCPIDVLYNIHVDLKVDLDYQPSDAARECLTRCIRHGHCKSSLYKDTKQCLLSSYSIIPDNFGLGGNTVFYINTTRWTDFKKSHKMEDLNSVGCGIREFEYYFISQDKQKEGSSIISSYSLERNRFSFIVTEAVFSTESRIQCASSCSLSGTCVAFSYSKNTCTLKKDM